MGVGSVRRVRGATASILLALAAGTAATGEVSEAEAKVRLQAAGELVAWANWCAKQGARTEGRAALAEATGLDRVAPGLRQAAEAVEALPLDSADAPAVEKQRKAVAADLAKAYDRLAALPHDKDDGARFADFALRAIRWEPTKARLDRGLRAADDASSRPEEAGRLLVGLRRLDVEGAAKGRYDALELKLALSDLVLVGSPAQRSAAWVSLPKGWRKGGSYPVLVAVDGAGANFLGSARSFRDTRGSRPVIVVEPVALSCTNKFEPGKFSVYDPEVLKEFETPGTGRLAFDGPGLVAVLDEVKARFGGEGKVFMTGFSGGGILTYWMLLQHPERMRGAAPSCANFGGGGLEGAPGAGPAGGPPIRILTGEKDPHREFTFGDRNQPGIEPQTDIACRTLKELGYANVQRTMVKGVGHAAQQGKVWEFVDEVLGRK